MQWRRQLAGGFRLRLLLRSRSWTRIAETAFVPRAPRSSEHELDAGLEREGRAARCDLVDGTVARGCLGCFHASDGEGRAIEPHCAGTREFVCPGVALSRWVVDRRAGVRV